MAKRNEKSLISIDDVIQYPVSPSLVTHSLENNIGGGIGISTDVISLSGISTIVPDDIIKIENEFMRIKNVGFGTTSHGPVIPGFHQLVIFHL